MVDGRRAFLAGIAALASSRLWAAPQSGLPDASSEGGQAPPPLTPQPSRHLPGSDRGDAAGDQPGASPDPRAILKQNQKDIKKDMAELETLVGELRKQVDTIDSANFLSLDLVHKAEDIEKLAHQIKTLARGV